MSILKYLQESFVTEELLTEVTADDKYAKQYDGKLDREIFDKSVSIDPTGDENRVGKYVDWIIKYYDIWKTLPDDRIEWFSKDLSLFDKFNSKIPLASRDINKITISEFSRLMHRLKEEGVFLSKKDKKKAERDSRSKETEFVLKNDKYVVLRPKTQKASQYWTMYGGGENGCSWCTGAKSDASCHFKQYDEVGTLYIIFDANDKDRKWQIVVADEGEELPNADYDGNTGEYEYRDCSNDGFDPYDEFANDPELISWMKGKGFPAYDPQESDEDREEREREDIQERIDDMISKFRATSPGDFDTLFETYWWEQYYEHFEADNIELSWLTLSNIDELWRRMSYLEEEDEYYEHHVKHDIESFFEQMNASSSIHDFVSTYIKNDDKLRDIDVMRDTEYIDDITDYVDGIVETHGGYTLEDSSNASNIVTFMDFVLEHPNREVWQKNTWTDEVNLEVMKDIIIDEGRDYEEIYKFFRFLGKSHKETLDEVFYNELVSDSVIKGEDGEDGSVELRQELETYKKEWEEWVMNNTKETNKED